MHLKKTCLFWLAVYVVIAGAVGVAVYRRAGSGEAAFPAGIFGGGAVWLGLAYIAGIRDKRREAKMIRKATSGERPADGERIAAVGTIMAAGGEELESPFSKTRCVAYEYKILDHRGKGVSTRYSGFALAPAMIQSSRGSIRILAFADLDFPSEQVVDEQAHRNAEAYLSSLPAESTRPGGIGAAIEEFKKLAADDDGNIRSDIGDAPSSFDIHQMTLSEKVLKPGDRVCAIGLYSAQRGGLVPEPGSFAHPVKITKGDADAMLRKITRSYFTNFTCGMILLAIAAVAAGAFLLMVPLDAAEQMNPDRPTWWPEVKLERLLDERVRAPLLEAGRIEQGGFISTNLSLNGARGVLEVGDVRVVLTQAEAKRLDGGVALRLIDDSGMRGIEVHVERDAVTRIELIGFPPHRGLEPNATIHALGFSGEAEGRLTLLDQSVRCRAAFRAAVE